MPAGTPEQACLPEPPGRNSGGNSDCRYYCDYWGKPPPARGPHLGVRAWRGWGTLAFPGFMHPSWAGGWLVQLGDNSSTGDHRFGFVWDRDQSRGAVVLHWVASQDACPFLQRSWLPEDLR